MSKKAYVGLIILTASLVIFILFISYLIWGKTWQVPSELKYDIFKDTLIIVLVIATFVIAIVGYGIYLILSGRLRAAAAVAASIESLKGSVRLFLVSGYTCWEHYEITGNKIPKYLEMAIELTGRAFHTYNALPESEAKKRENEKECYRIKNNLAYYLAERKKPEDKDTAKEYADCIHDGFSKYPEEKANWLDTYDFVYQQYKL